MVGRRAELAVLRAVFGADAGAAIVVVRGEAGIGKSRLIDEFVREALASGAVVHRGAAFADWQSAFAMWVQALGGEYFGEGSGAPADSAEATLRMFTALRDQLVRAAGDRRLVLVFDDVHWADRDSLRLLEFIAPRLGDSPVLLVVAHRDPDPSLATGAPLSRALGVVLRCAATTTLDLTGLDALEVGELVAETLGGEPPGALVRAICGATDGNPLFVRELARHLAATGQVVSRDGRWSSDVSTSELGIPSTVRLVVRERLSSMPAPTVAVLQVAAIAGASFELESVASVAGVEYEPGMAAVDEALAHGLVERVGGVGAKYRFSHALVRDAVADTVNPSRRLQVHASLAEAIRVGKAGTTAVEVAGHLWLARGSVGVDDATVIEALVDAATLLAASGAHGEVIECADRLLVVIGPRGSKELVGHAWSIKAMASAALLDTVTAIAATRSAMAVLDVDEVSTLVARVVSLLREGVPRESWEPLVREAFDRIGASDDAVGCRTDDDIAAQRSGILWARLAVLVDPVDVVLDGPLYAGRWTGYPEKAVVALRQSADEVDRALSVGPFEHRSLADTERLLLTVRSWSHPVAVRRGLDLVARDLALRHGRLEDARRLYEELLTLGVQTQSIPAQLEAHAFAAFCDALLGDLESATRHLGAAAVFGTDLWPTHRLHALTPMMRAVVLYCRGGDVDVSSVHVAVGHGTELAAVTEQLWGFVHRPGGSGPFSVVMMTIGAVSAALSRDVIRARIFLENAVIGIGRLSPMDHGVGGALWFGSAAAHLLNDVDAAAELIALLDRQTTADAPPGPCVSFAHSRGRLAAVMGRHVEAVEAFAQARDDYRVGGHLSLAALVDADEALLDGPRLSMVETRAATAFDDLGMIGWRRRLLDRRTDDSPRLLPGTVGGLSRRESEVLRLVSTGLTNNEIAERLYLSPATVNRHVANVYLKLGVRNRSEATAWAHGNGLMAT